MIRTLELKNWRTHKHSLFEFNKGTNVIIGVMGSGKSSVMNALSYALFGNFPQLKSKQIALNEIIMNKPNVCEEAEVKIVFENNAKEYLVQRIIKLSGTNESKLFEKGILIAGPKQKDVNEKIEEILGLNYELFSRAAYSEQNETDFFLKLSPSERKKKFDELLDLERYEVVRKNVNTLQNNLVKNNNLRKESVSQQKKLIQIQEETQLKSRIELEEKSINDLLVKEKEFGERIVLVEKEFGEEVDKEIKFLKISEHNTKIVEQVYLLREFIKKYEKLDQVVIEKEIKQNNDYASELKKNIEIIEAEIKLLINKEKGYKTLKELLIKNETLLENLNVELIKKIDLNEIKTSLNKNEVEKKSLILEKKMLLENNNACQKKLDELKNQIKINEFELKQIIQEEKEISIITDKCPKCKQEMSIIHKNQILEELTSRKQDLFKQNDINNKELEEQNKTFSELNKKIEELDQTNLVNLKEKIEIENKEKHASELEKKEEKRKLLLEENPKILLKISQLGFDEKKLDKNRDNQKSFERLLNETKNKIFLKQQELEKVIEKNNKQEELIKKENEQKENDEKLRLLNFNKQFLEQKRTELNSIKTQIVLIKEQIKSKNSLIKSLEENLEKINQIKKMVITQEEKISKINKFVENLNVFSNCLIATQNELRETMLETINIALTQIWSVLYPYKDFVDIKISVSNTGYHLHVLTQQNNWVRVEGILSGGERSAAAICTRMAFSLVLTKQLSLFILDEPTHNLDQNAINKLSEMLNTTLPRLVGQIFVITHEKELEKAATNDIYFLKRNKDSNEATKIDLVQINN